MSATHKLDDLDCTALPAGLFELPEYMIWVNLATPVGGMHRVAVFKSGLTAVKPPLPPEPDPVSVVLDRYLRAWQHVSSGRGDWCCAMDDLGADWEELNREYGPLVLLDSAPEPVELPWASQPYEVGIMRTTVNATSDGVVDANSNGHTGVAVVMPPEQAREKARALNTAADQAEATS